MQGNACQNAQQKHEWRGKSHTRTGFIGIELLHAWLTEASDVEKITSDVTSFFIRCVKASDSVVLALDLMSKRGFRHLPVMEGGQLYGIVSIRDLYRNVKEQMDDDILMLAETLIQG